MNRAYDAPGNMTNDGFHSYTYDADGNILNVDNGSTAQYVYDPLNRRVSVTYGGTQTEFVFDNAGRRISSWPVALGYGNEGRIYWGGDLFAFRDYNGSTYFDHRDFTGTVRAQTDYTGALTDTHTSLPWGDSLVATPANAPTQQETLNFAGLDLDYETNTHHAQFRNYSSAQGRWLSPDRYSGSYDLANPQSLNRYAYVLNNPLAFVDPLGLDGCDVGEDGIGTAACNAPPPGCESGCNDQYGNYYTPTSTGITGATDFDYAGDPWDGPVGYTPTANGTGGYYLPGVGAGSSSYSAGSSSGGGSAVGSGAANGKPKSKACASLQAKAQSLSRSSSNWLGSAYQDAFLHSITVGNISAAAGGCIAGGVAAGAASGGSAIIPGCGAGAFTTVTNPITQLVIVGVGLYDAHTALTQQQAQASAAWAEYNSACE